MSADNLPRLKDVVFALAAAGKFRQPLGRLPLQKIIYLADVLAPIWREIANPSGFSPYLNGPYDRRIQNTVDALVFRGIAQVSSPAFRRIDRIECQYSLTQDGYDLVNQLIRQPGLHKDLELFQEIASEVSRRGWQHIKALVYAEPTYDTARTTGNSGQLRTDSATENLSREFLRHFRQALQGTNGTPISRSNLVQIFFSVLDQHAIIKAESTSEDVS